jgi:hypothetical protein
LQAGSVQFNFQTRKFSISIAHGVVNHSFPFCVLYVLPASITGLALPDFIDSPNVLQHYGKEIVAKELGLPIEHPDVQTVYLAVYKNFLEVGRLPLLSSC